MKVYRADETELVRKGGYTARYIADIVLDKAIGSAGFILVEVEAGMHTMPHAHEELDEVFIFLDEGFIKVDEAEFQVETGDIFMVKSNEFHSLTATSHSGLRVIAVKLPNLKKDKIEANPHQTP